MATRWGICGAGKISSDFCHCLNFLPDTEHQIAAVASRDKERGDAFASKFKIPKVYTAYSDMAKDSSIDVVYIAAQNPYHVELSLMFINAGHNVLCEKPMAVSVEGCHKVLQAAKAKGVLFVEGFWSRFFPAYQFIQDHVNSGAIGEVKMVQANIELLIKDFTLGALFDLGVYPIQATNLFFKDRPIKIDTASTRLDRDVDIVGMMQLTYPGDRFAQLTYSADYPPGAGSFTIRGTKGNIVIPYAMWAPDRVILQGNVVKEFPLPDIKGPFNYIHSQGLCYEIQGVRDCLLKGLKESPRMPHEDIKTINYIVTEVGKLNGIEYNHL